MAENEPIARDYEELARIFGQMKYFQSEVHSADDIIEKERVRRTHALEQLESYRVKAKEALPKVGLAPKAEVEQKKDNIRLIHRGSHGTMPRELMTDIATAAQLMRNGWEAP